MFQCLVLYSAGDTAYRTAAAGVEVPVRYEQDSTSTVAVDCGLDSGWTSWSGLWTLDSGGPALVRLGCQLPYHSYAYDMTYIHVKEYTTIPWTLPKSQRIKLDPTILNRD